MSAIRFQDPIWLAVAATALPLVVVGLRWFAAMTCLRRFASVALRVLLFAVLAAALAGAVLHRQVDKQAVIAIVDRSASIRRLYEPGLAGPNGEAGGAEADPLTRRLEGFLNAASAGHRRVDDVSAVIVYDTAALASSPLETRGAGSFIDGSLSMDAATDPAGTDTARAVRTAAAMAPPNAVTRLVLFWDGNDTSGDVLEAARSLVRGRGEGRMSLDVVPLVYAAPRDVAIASIEAPSMAAAEATVLLRIALDASAPISGELRVAREGQPIDASADEPGLGRRLTLPAGRTIVRVPVRLPAGRVHRFQAVFEPDADEQGRRVDAIEENNRAESLTLTPGRSSVLIIDGVSGATGRSPANSSEVGRLGDTFRAAGLEVETQLPSAIPNDPIWFQRFDLIAMQNVPADGLSDGVSQAIADYVTRQGGGLVMIGGPDSFGAGGWRGTPIEPILPVRLELPERLLSPAAAVVIVIDCSGSMGFRVGGSRRSKQAIANDGAAAAVRSLDKTDLVGVIIFNNQPDVLIALAPNADAERSAKRIDGIEADGGTNIPPALELAAAQLRRVKADTKHIIVLSDGRSQNTGLLPGMSRRIAADGIKVSTIAVGDEADGPTMSEMASLGGGAFYRVVDPNLLPRIFVKAVRVVRTPLIREQSFQPVPLATGSPIIEGLSGEGSGIPPLNGLVLTQPRADPTVTYAMLAGTPTGQGESRRGGEPLLAHWNAGVGHVAAFTSDAHRWAAPWLAWPGYARMWTQLVRTIARPQAERGQELFVESDGDDLVIAATLRDADGRPIDAATVTGSARGPGGEVRSLDLSQIGAGEYRTRVRVPDAGSWVVTLSPRAGDKPLPPLVGGVSRSGGAEFRRLSTNMEAIREVAQAAGGRVIDLDNPLAAGLFDRAGVPPVRARESIWRWLIILGISLYLLDVGSRRVAWDRLLPERAAVRRRAAASADASARAANTVGRLRVRDTELEQQVARGESPPKLSTDDARAIVKAQAERRRQERTAARQGRAEPASSSETATTPAPSNLGESASSEAKSAERPSSLHDAKRRARERFDEDAPGRSQSGTSDD